MDILRYLLIGILKVIRDIVGLALFCAVALGATLVAVYVLSYFILYTTDDFVSYPEYIIKLIIGLSAILLILGKVVLGEWHFGGVGELFVWLFVAAVFYEAIGREDILNLDIVGRVLRVGVVLLVGIIAMFTLRRE